jgi:hypothetical protein
MRISRPTTVRESSLLQQVSHQATSPKPWLLRIHREHRFQNICHPSLLNITYVQNIGYQQPFPHSGCILELHPMIPCLRHLMSWCAMIRACIEVVYAAIDDVDHDRRHA